MSSTTHIIAPLADKESADNLSVVVDKPSNNQSSDHAKSKSTNCKLKEIPSSISMSAVEPSTRCIPSTSIKDTAFIPSYSHNKACSASNTGNNQQATNGINIRCDEEDNQYDYEQKLMNQNDEVRQLLNDPNHENEEEVVDKLEMDKEEMQEMAKIAEIARVMELEEKKIKKEKEEPVKRLAVTKRILCNFRLLCHVRVRANPGKDIKKSEKVTDLPVGQEIMVEEITESHEEQERVRISYPVHGWLSLTLWDRNQDTFITVMEPLHDQLIVHGPILGEAVMDFWEYPKMATIKKNSVALNLIEIEFPDVFGGEDITVKLSDPILEYIPTVSHEPDDPELGCFFDLPQGKAYRFTPEKQSEYIQPSLALQQFILADMGLIPEIQHNDHQQQSAKQVERPQVESTHQLNDQQVPPPEQVQVIKVIKESESKYVDNEYQAAKSESDSSYSDDSKKKSRSPGYSRRQRNKRKRQNGPTKPPLPQNYQRLRQEAQSQQQPPQPQQQAQRRRAQKPQVQQPTALPPAQYAHYEQQQKAEPMLLPDLPDLPVALHGHRHQEAVQTEVHHQHGNYHHGHPQQVRQSQKSGDVQVIHVHHHVHHQSHPQQVQHQHPPRHQQRQQYAYQHEYDYQHQQPQPHPQRQSQRRTRSQAQPRTRTHPQQVYPNQQVVHFQPHQPHESQSRRRHQVQPQTQHRYQHHQHQHQVHQRSRTQSQSRSRHQALPRPPRRQSRSEVEAHRLQQAQALAAHQAHQQAQQAQQGAMGDLDWSFINFQLNEICKNRDAPPQFINVNGRIIEVELVPVEQVVREQHVNNMYANNSKQRRF